MKRDPKSRKNHGNIVKKRKQIQANDEVIKQIKATLKSESK